MKEVKKSLNKDYIGRVNQTIDFINKNLDKDLNLANLSKIAMYSPFHFHRIFSAIVNEPLNTYISRKRIEKSTSLLKPESQIPISEIAHEFGFSSNAAYTKAFKKFYGISPSKFKEQNVAFSKIGKTKSKNGQVALQFSTYLCNIEEYKKWMNMYAKIEVKGMPALQVAYVTHVGAFHLIGEAFKKLMRWAAPKGLSHCETITVYHDDPNITDISQVRQAAGLILNAPIETSGEVGTMQIEQGKFAVGTFELSYSDFEKAWQSMFVWINENGYETSTKDCYQIYRNQPNQHSQGKSLVEICVPVK